MQTASMPRMIVFDYGDTLLYEPDWNPLRGEEALFQYIKTNKRNLTPREVCDYSLQLFGQLGQARSQGFEIHNHAFQRLLYESLEIELTVSYPEAEKIFWDYTTPGAVMPQADQMLDSISALGIRSGVISNISFSGAALAAWLNRLLPNNRFEFIIASSEYAFRKPSRLLFELALKKAGLPAQEVWFCGDNIQADIEGAAQAGLFPVWYENAAALSRPGGGAKKPGCKHLHIHEWEELIYILKSIGTANRAGEA